MSTANHKGFSTVVWGDTGLQQHISLCISRVHLMKCLLVADMQQRCEGFRMTNLYSQPVTAVYSHHFCASRLTMMYDNSLWVLVSYPHDSYHELLEFGCEPLWHSGILCMSLSISQKLSTMIFWSFLEKALLWNSSNFVFLLMFYCWWFSSSSIDEVCLFLSHFSTPFLST
jgi:hypothetical protein